MNDFDPNYIDKNVVAKISQKVIIFNSLGQILFLKRSDKCSRPHGWDFPGGGLDLGEDPKKGIIREIFEETNFTITNIKPIILQSEIDINNNFIVIVGYTAETTDNIPKLSWEHSEFEWINAKDSLKIDLPTIHRKILEKALTK